MLASLVSPRLRGELIVRRRGTLVGDGRTSSGAGTRGTPELLVLRDAGGDLCPRVPRTEAAHGGAGDARGVLPLRECRQLHPAGRRATAGAHFRHPGGSTGAGDRSAGVHPARQALPQAGGAGAFPPLPAVPQPPGRAAAGTPDADPNTTRL